MPNVLQQYEEGGTKAQERLDLIHHPFDWTKGHA
jgi:hypothetical protein